MTGGRIKRIQKYIGDETFMLTYGDGVSNIDISKLVDYHNKSGKLATLTAVNVVQKFGILEINSNNEIKSFREKSQDDGSLINGGYMVLGPQVFNYINGDDTIFEKEPLEKLSKEGKLGAYKHSGFWQCMDTLRDKNKLEEMWNSKSAPWKVW